jgi:four helix bundle protein
MTTANAGSGYTDPLERLTAYRLGLEAASIARLDAGEFARDPMMRDVAGQLMRAAGSISANIAEGYSRGTTADRRKFLEYALGSARECVVWYTTTAHPERKERIERLTSIRCLLLTMIKTARLSVKADAMRFER